MRKTVKVGDMVVEFCANGATPLRYKQIFHKDLLKFFDNASKEGVDDAFATETVMELSFIMAMQAKGGDLSKLTEEEYYEWLSQCEANDIPQNASDIIDVYMGNTKTDSELKKESAPQADA